MLLVVAAAGAATAVAFGPDFAHTGGVQPISDCSAANVAAQDPAVCAQGCTGPTDADACQKLACDLNSTWTVDPMYNPNQFVFNMSDFCGCWQGTDANNEPHVLWVDVIADDSENGYHHCSSATISYPLVWNHAAFQELLPTLQFAENSVHPVCNLQSQCSPPPQTCPGAYEWHECAALVPSAHLCPELATTGLGGLCPLTCGCNPCADEEPDCPASVVTAVANATTDADRRAVCLEASPDLTDPVGPNYYHCPVSCPNQCIPGPPAPPPPPPPAPAACPGAYQYVTCGELVPSADDCSALANTTIERLCPRTCGCNACNDTEPDCPVASLLENITDDTQRQIVCLDKPANELNPNYVNCPVSCPNQCIPYTPPTPEPTSSTGSSTPGTHSSPDPYGPDDDDPGGGGGPGGPDGPPLPPPINQTDECNTHQYAFNTTPALCAGTLNVLPNPYCAFEFLDARIANCRGEDLDFPIISGAESDYFRADIPKNVTSLDYFWSRLQTNPSYTVFNLGPSNDRQTVNAWNASGITSMVEAFALANYNLNMAAWDVSSVTNMSRAFACGLVNCSYSHNLQEWDVSSGTDFTDMFAGNRLIHTNIGLWDLSGGGATIETMLGSGPQRACYNHDLGNETYCAVYSQFYAGNITHMPDVFWRAENFINATDLECQLTFSAGTECCYQPYCDGGACDWCSTTSSTASTTTTTTSTTNASETPAPRNSAPDRRAEDSSLSGGGIAAIVVSGVAITGFAVYYYVRIRTAPAVAKPNILLQDLQPTP